MAYDPTIWKDRVVEKPRTYCVQNNPDGTITLIPAPGEVYEEGTPVNALNLNKLEQGLKTHEAEKASKTAFGHVKVGDRLSVTAGVISADVQVETASGSYVGDGEEDRFIQVGFTPKFVYLSIGVGSTNRMFMCQSTSGATFHTYTTGGGEHEGITTLRITTNGFIVSGDDKFGPNRTGDTYLWTCYS